MPTNEDSMRGQIARLKPGECFSRSLRLSKDENIAARLESLRNAIAPSLQRAANATGNLYSLETGHWMTRDYTVVVTAIVTRNANA